MLLNINKSLLISVLLASVTLPIYAQQMQCPGSTNFISVGDTIPQVVSQCGQPEKTIQIKNDLVLWQYSFIAFYSHSYGFSLVFDNQIVKKIAEGVGIARSSIGCPHGSVSVGNTMAQVISACGHPHVTKDLTQSQYGGPQLPKITHLIYQPQSYLPETTFIFKDGRLSGTK